MKKSKARHISAAAKAVEPPPRSHLWGFWPSALALLVLACLVFAPALHNEFVLDDEAEVSKNDLVQSLDHVANVFFGSTMNQGGSSPLGGIYYRPMMMLSFAIIWRAVGADPFYFHLFQLILHVGCAWILLALLRRWFVAEIAVFIAALFLIHPLNAEAVVYISSLQDPMFLLFGLGGLYLSTRREPLTWPSATAIGALFLCSLLTKETGALLMILAAAYAASFQRKNLRPVLIAVAGAAVVYAFMRFDLAKLSALTDSTTQIARASFGVRMLTVPAALFSYLWKFVYPSRLSVTQDWVVPSAGLLDFWLPLFGVIAIGALSYFTGGRFQDNDRRRFYFFFVLWAALGLGLHSHILVPIDGTVSDRWFYMTSIGMIAATTLALASLATWSQAPQALVYSVAVIIMASLAVRTTLRAADWKDGYTLYSHDVLVSPETFYLHGDLGVEHFRRGEFVEAKKCFEKAVELYPEWPTGWNNLGAVYQRGGDITTAEQLYSRSIKYGPYLLAYENYADILILQGRNEDLRKFLVEKGLRAFPGSTKLKNIYASLNTFK